MQGDFADGLLGLYYVTGEVRLLIFLYPTTVGQRPSAGWNCRGRGARPVRAVTRCTSLCWTVPDGDSVALSDTPAAAVPGPGRQRRRLGPQQ